MTAPLAFHLLKHFKPSEFGDSVPYMHESTLLMVDAFREYWRAPVSVSPAEGGLARWLGPDAMSGHNVDRWGHCMAADLFPKGMDTAKDMVRAVACAISAGATGIGLYTDTSPGFMIHLDTRPDRTPYAPRLWSRIDGEYGPIGDALNACGERTD